VLHREQFPGEVQNPLRLVIQQNKRHLIAIGREAGRAVHYPPAATILFSSEKLVELPVAGVVLIPSFAARTRLRLSALARSPSYLLLKGVKCLRPRLATIYCQGAKVAPWPRGW